jgi:DNA-binding Lrp family transcriptional regulator
LARPQKKYTATAKSLILEYLGRNTQGTTAEISRAINRTETHVSSVLSGLVKSGAVKGTLLGTGKRAAKSYSLPFDDSLRKSRFDRLSSDPWE